MADHGQRLNKFPAETLEGRQRVGSSRQIAAPIAHPIASNGAPVQGETGLAVIDPAIGRAIAAAVAAGQAEGRRKGEGGDVARPDRLPPGPSSWLSPSQKGEKFERWILDESTGDFVRAADLRVPVDPLEDYRRRERIVVFKTDQLEVVQYRDGWGNVTTQTEWAEGITPPEPIWREPVPKLPRPSVPGAALGKIANSVSKAPKNTAWLLAARARPWQRDRTARCRIKRIGHQSVQVRSDGTSVSVTGIETCASVWGCPVCAQAIYAERANELQTATKAWRALGPNHVVVMLTTTVRHELCTDLKWLRRGVSNSWRAMWQGRRAKLLKAELGIVHTVRGLEVTHGNHGWHPHLHTLCFLKLRKPPESDDEIWDDEQLATLRSRWIDAVERVLGVGALPNWERGLNVRISHRDDYIAKLGLEVASIAGKQGRIRNHRTPWQLLRSATDGDVPAQHLWRHYTANMLGARQLTWSKGTKRFFKIAEKSDQEIAEAREKLLTEPHIAFEIAGWLWDRLVKVPGWLPAFVAAIRENPTLARDMLPPTSPDVDKRSWYQFDRGG